MRSRSSLKSSRASSCGDDPLEPGREIRRIPGRGRPPRRQLEIDRACRRIWIEIEHQRIRRIVPGAKHQPAAGVDRQLAFGVERATVTREHEASYHSSVVHQLEVIDGDGRAERHPECERAGRGARDGGSRPLAGHLETEQWTVAHEAPPRLDRVSHGLGDAATGGCDEDTRQAHRAAKRGVVRHRIRTCACSHREPQVEQAVPDGSRHADGPRNRRLQDSPPCRARRRPAAGT